MPSIPKQDTLDAMLARIGWSARELAVRLDAHPNTINDWRLARRRTPERVRQWLERLAAYHLAHPAPAWRNERSNKQ